MALKPIRKAVIPAAGLGTRFLPATKAVPKELLPIVDTPTIQYIVAEAVAAGVRDVIIVNAKGKETIVDHFDVAKELESHLAKAGKTALRDEIRAIAKMANVVSIRQQEPLGLGHAVLCAKDLVGDEPFVVMLGDDIMLSGNVVSEMLEVYNRYGRSVICGMEVPRSDIHLYGAITPEFVEENLARVLSIVEKPKAEEAPSNLAAIGRYVLTPEIFDALRETPPDLGGEIQLTDAINTLAQQQTVYAYLFDGVRYDIGKKLDYLRATVELAIDRDDLGPEFRAFLAELVQRKKLL